MPFLVYCKYQHLNIFCCCYQKVSFKASVLVSWIEKLPFIAEEMDSFLGGGVPLSLHCLFIPSCLPLLPPLVWSFSWASQTFPLMSVVSQR